MFHSLAKNENHYKHLSYLYIMFRIFILHSNFIKTDKIGKIIPTYSKIGYNFL